MMLFWEGLLSCSDTGIALLLPRALRRSRRDGTPVAWQMQGTFAFVPASGSAGSAIRYPWHLKRLAVNQGRHVMAASQQ